jgi:hypothetical protein
MIEGHIIFNAILYSIVIAYILYINFSAYYQTGTGFLKALVNLFQNWIFRTVYLLIVGFFALDLFPYGGFVLAILLTIAFLNTNMLVYKKDVEESMTNKNEKNAKLPSDGTIQSTTTGGSFPPPPSPSSVGIQPTQVVQPPAPANIQQMGQQQMNQQQMGQQQMGQPMGTAPMGTAPMGTAPMRTAPMGTAPMGTAPMGTAPMGQPTNTMGQPQMQ